MTIDGGRETVSGVSPGNFSSLHVDMGVIFVGGTPLVFPPSNLIRFRTTGEEVYTTIRILCVCEHRVKYKTVQFVSGWPKFRTLKGQTNQPS